MEPLESELGVRHRLRAPSRHRRTARLPRRAQVRNVSRLTDTGTVLLSFLVTDDQPFQFAPGQFVAIDFVHPRLGYRRSPYCLFGASSEERTFQLLVRVVPDGPVSLFLGSLDVGDVVSFRGPSGHSMIPREEETHLVLMATGVGLGPCRLLLRHLASVDPRRRVALYWGLRQEADVCLLDELLALEREMPAFSWEITMTEPEGEWPPLRGRLTETVPPRIGPLDNKHFYLVSNGAMIAEMGAALREVGVPGWRIYEESFFNHRHKPDRDEVMRIARLFDSALVADVEEFRRRYSSG